MTDRRRQPLARSILRGLTTAGLLWSAVVACGGDGSDTEEPNCVEDQLANGTGLRFDASFAIAMSRAIEYSHPELSPLVDTVADFQMEHPDYQALDVEDIDASSGQVTMTYVAALLALSERPDIATPELIEILTGVAEDEGLAGVNNVVHAESRFPVDDFGGDALVELRSAVFDIGDALADQGIQDLPNPGCTMEDAFGGEG